MPSGTYTTKEFVERVSMMHHIPHAQLVGAVEAITDELQTLLSRGYIVEFGDLGHFSLTLSLEKEITDRKEVRSPSVHLKNIKLKVKQTYKRELNSKMDLERISSPTRSNMNISEEECLKRLQDFLEKHPCINRADYCAITGMNKTQAIRQLNLFIEKGVIQKYGIGKTVVYIRVV
ncbi:DNA-binding protein [Bacteroides thetaiotaomicron]|nr:DNA-binding protein [Bacteroides thetaiotaomicron]